MKHAELEQLLGSAEENGGIQNLTLEHTELNGIEFSNIDFENVVFDHCRRGGDLFVTFKIKLLVIFVSGILCSRQTGDEIDAGAFCRSRFGPCRP